MIPSTTLSKNSLAYQTKIAKEKRTFRLQQEKLSNDLKLRYKNTKKKDGLNQKSVEGLSSVWGVDNSPLSKEDIKKKLLKARKQKF